MARVLGIRPAGEALAGLSKTCAQGSTERTLAAEWAGQLFSESGVGQLVLL